MPCGQWSELDGVRLNLAVKLFGKHRAPHADIARPCPTNGGASGGSVQPMRGRQVLGETRLLQDSGRYGGRGG